MVGKGFLYIKLIFVLIQENNGIPSGLCKNGWAYGNPNCEIIYVWDKDRADFVSLFNVTLSRNKASDLQSIRGKTVRVIADNMLPYITSSNYSQSLGGFLGDIWQLIENALGFKTSVSSVNYVTGLELITSGKADVMLAAVVVKDDLVNVQYSQPYFYNWYHLFVKMPEAKASSSSYLKTFDEPLWFVTLIIFAILTIALWMTTKLLNKLFRIEPPISLPSCFLGTTAGFINQGFDLKLSSYSGRMQVMFALVLGIVLYSAMNAVLVAQLAVFDIPFPFVSLDDIAARRTHSLCLRSNSFVYNNFSNANKEVIPRWKGIVNAPPCLDINNQTNLVKIMCYNNLVILESRVVMDTILKHHDTPCEMLSHSERYFKKANSFVLLRSFEYTRIVDGMVKKLRSSGILQRLEYKWVRRGKLLNENTAKSPQVTLDHVEGLLEMYFSLVLISLVILFIEILYYRYVT